MPYQVEQQLLEYVDDNDIDKTKQPWFNFKRIDEMPLGLAKELEAILK